MYVGSRPGTFITVSRVTLTPTAEDDGAVLRCAARHPALDGAQGEHPHLKNQAVLSVLCKKTTRGNGGDASWMGHMYVSDHY